MTASTHDIDKLIMPILIRLEVAIGGCRTVVSVPVSVHQPAPDRTQAVWLDLAPDLSSTNSTQAHWVDGEHQPNGVGSQLVGVVIVEVWAGGRPVGEHSHQPEP